MLRINIEDKIAFKEVGNSIVKDLCLIIEERKRDWHNNKYSNALGLSKSNKREIDRFFSKMTFEYIENLVFLKPQKLKNEAIFYITEKKHKYLIKIIRDIFLKAYKDKFQRKKFINSLGLKTCPYCNRAYTYTIENGNINPQIDHFYYKAKYPLFAVSLYNLIPACATCNSSGAKGEKDTLLGEYAIHSPHEINDSEFEFGYKLLSPTLIKGTKRIIDSDVKVYFKKKNEIYDKLFHLSSLYAQHADHIVDLLYKRKYVYDDETLKYLRKLAGKNFKRETLDRFIVGGYVTVTKYHKRPLSKLYTEIAKDIGLIV